MSRKSEILIALLLSGILVCTSPCFWSGVQLINADSTTDDYSLVPEDNLNITQENTLVATRNLSNPDVVSGRVTVIVTAYSSSPDETDSTPNITASGKETMEGVVANNLLPFGTQIKIPELFEDEIFTVEDRMHSRKGYYHIDIWFPTKEEAKIFGTKTTYIEILEG